MNPLQHRQYQERNLTFSCGRTHNNHHYIPSFLLKQWESGTDKKLSAMRWIRGEIFEDRYKAKSVAKQRNLYTIHQSRDEPNQALELEFMTKKIDEPAAQVHQKILKGPLINLTEAERHIWTQFLVSLALRGPGAVAHVRKRGIDALGDELDADTHEFFQQRNDQPESSLRSYVEKHEPDLLNDFGPKSLPFLIQTSPLNRLILEANWMSCQITNTTENLLIGDRPLILLGSLKEQFMLYLPVAPNKAFMVFNSPETGKNIGNKTNIALQRVLNRSMVEQASVYVYGVRLEHKQLLQCRLAKEPAGPGLAFGPRPKPVSEQGIARS